MSSHVMVVLPNCRLSRAERGPFSPAVSSAACLYPLTRTAHHLYLLTLDIYIYNHLYISTRCSRYPLPGPTKSVVFVVLINCALMKVELWKAPSSSYHSRSYSLGGEGAAAGEAVQEQVKKWPIKPRLWPGPGDRSRPH